MVYLLKCYTQIDGTSLSSAKSNIVTHRKNVSDRTCWVSKSGILWGKLSATDRQTDEQ